MTDEEIKTYVTGRIDALLDGMTDVASLPQAEPDGGTTLPFVKGGRLVAAPVAALGGARKLWGQSFDGSADVSGDLALANRKITWSGHGSNYVGDGGKDYSPTVGGELANLVISAWYGLSFTTDCDGTYKGKTSVGIDTRSGIVRAAKVEAASAMCRRCR